MIRVQGDRWLDCLISLSLCVYSFLFFLFIFTLYIYFFLTLSFFFIFFPRSNPLPYFVFLSAIIHHRQQIQIHSFHNSSSVEPRVQTHFLLRFISVKCEYIKSLQSASPSLLSRWCLITIVYHLTTIHAPPSLTIWIRHHSKKQGGMKIKWVVSWSPSSIVRPAPPAPENLLARGRAGIQRDFNHQTSGSDFLAALENKLYALKRDLCWHLAEISLQLAFRSRLDYLPVFLCNYIIYCHLELALVSDSIFFIILYFIFFRFIAYLRRLFSLSLSSCHR